MPHKLHRTPNFIRCITASHAKRHNEFALQCPAGAPAMILKTERYKFIHYDYSDK